jgi:hypothetical protein
MPKRANARITSGRRVVSHTCAACARSTAATCSAVASSRPECRQERVCGHARDRCGEQSPPLPGWLAVRGGESLVELLLPDVSGAAELGWPADEQLNQLIDIVGGNVGVPDVALRLGADMPARPGRAPFLQCRQNPAGRRRDPVRVDVKARRTSRTECFADHGLDRLRSSERFGGLGVPDGALLGQGAVFALGVPGLQGGLQRKPGALPGSTALAQARAAGSFTAAHDASWASRPQLPL